MIVFYSASGFHWILRDGVKTESGENARAYDVSGSTILISQLMKTWKQPYSDNRFLWHTINTTTKLRSGSIFVSL